MTIRNLQYYAVTVPDLDLAERYYTDFGLEKASRSDELLVFRCFGRAQDQLFFIKGAEKKFHHICFGCQPEDIEGIKERLAAQNIELLDPPKCFPDEGIWFRDFEGALTRIVVADAAEYETGLLPVFNIPGNTSRLGERSSLVVDPPVRPRRLGHVVLYSTDLERKVQFYADTFGMRLADGISHFLRFMYCSTGSDHHVVAFAKSKGLGINHAGFEVGCSDEVAMGGRQMGDKGYELTWGPGRHGPGSNAFFYMRDPWQGMVEYFADMDYIPEGADWEPGIFEKSETIVWGTIEPADFGKNSDLPHEPAGAGDPGHKQ